MQPPKLTALAVAAKEVIRTELFLQDHPQKIAAQKAIREALAMPEPPEQALPRQIAQHLTDSLMTTLPRGQWYEFSTHAKLSSDGATVFVGNAFLRIIHENMVPAHVVALAAAPESGTNLVERLTAERDAYRSELENIVNAKRKDFEDGDEFREWAQNRARHTLRSFKL